MNENKHTPEPYAYMTLESQWRLGNGGNCKGAVPIHKHKSSTAKIPLYEQSAIDDLTSQRDELLAALEGLTSDIQSLIGESCGVSGLHMNGDIAPWDEIESGGRFERLTHLPCAHAAIAIVKGEQP